MERTWSAAARDLVRSAAGHKVVTLVVAACVLATFTVIVVIGTTSHAAVGTGTGLNADGTGAIVPAGQPAAPAFSFPELGHAGATVSLAGYAGKPLIVNFFASWCPPCKKETPMLARFYRTESRTVSHAGHGSAGHGSVPMVGLDENDSTANALAFARANGVTYPLAWDPGLIASSAYHVAAMPQTFFLDAGHRIVYHVIGQITAAELSKGISLAAG